MMPNASGVQTYYQPPVVQNVSPSMQTMPQMYPSPPQQGHMSMVGYPPSTIQGAPAYEMQHETARSPPQELKGETASNAMGSHPQSVASPESGSSSTNPSTPSQKQEIMTHNA